MAKIAKINKATPAAVVAATNGAGFASLVQANKRAILAAADKLEGTRDGLRGIIEQLAQYALANGMTRAGAGRTLADVLGFRSLGDRKDIANAWQWAAKQVGLESQKKGAAQKASAPDTTTGEGAETKGAESEAKIPVSITPDATAADVVTALRKWIKAHKAAGREVLEILATWKELTAAQAAIAAAG